ncbi:chromatin associated protein KTI12 [Fimicolochytrium jonesii]|uniref:chromatin associated protein KTI12 n=1 Tax=Fimicolochytrium jonesii TaxID=1396493 RepID=UPI0022FE7BD1|nr:chromatin associated protein KTI12 [Fimicolochytrium jonesii]KAI8826190.1 chromatin associated protein KTI12 [Fimicolochytrium jonesii]
MPLITICGVPQSGKTTRALLLKEEIEIHLAAETTSTHDPNEPNASAGDGRKKTGRAPPVMNRTVVVVNEESLGIDKGVAYSSPHEEKKARGALLSAIERHLSRDTIVICDSLNYIKGFRYQLFCVARALGTPTCTVFCARPFEKGATPSPNTQLTPILIANLTSRFEEPESRNRWDAPLFTLLPTDPSPLPHILAALLRTPPPPNLSTVVKPLTETNYLHEMDRKTGEVVEFVWKVQNDPTSEGNGSSTAQQPRLRLPPRIVPLAELRRLRRQYTTLNRMHTQLDVRKVVDGFVEYLNTNLE